MASNPKATGSAAPSKKQSNELMQRGVYGSDPAGSALFIALRSLDPVLQYGILKNGLGSSLLHKIGLTTLPAGPPNTGTFLDKFGLSPYRLILLAMATGTTVKHLLWLGTIGNEAYGPPAATLISVMNTILNSINTLAFTTTLASASLSSGSQFPQTTLLVGSVLYVAGMAIELVSEYDRKRFKKDPANKGKLYTGGLWKLTRHANYLGYTLSRAGFSIAASGWTLGAIFGGFFAANFLFASIPEIEKYTSEKYGVQWQEYERKTPYKLIPYVI